MFFRLAIASRSTLIRAAVFPLLALVTATASAGAPFCALRDPGHQIYEMFPEATGHRSVVREINTETQVAVGAQIPFGLHKGELGQHTLYVPVEGKRPLGYIQIRSELTEWGLAEIVWALNKRLEIRDFRFQRCRGRTCRTVMDKGLEELVRAKDQETLLGMVDDTGMLRPEHSHSMSDDERLLAGAVIRSGIKVIAVIESGWASTVQELGSTPDT